jgi:16S rRNA processing protein RimM
VILFPGDEAGEAPAASWPSLILEAARPFRRGFLVRFEGIGDRSEAEALHGRYLFRPRGEVEELQDGEVFYHQLLGLRVVTVAGAELGDVVEVYELRPSDLLEVRGPDGTRHIPFHRSIVREVDIAGGRLVIDPPDGLLDLV